MLACVLLIAAISGASDAPRDTLRLALMHGVPEKWNVEKNFSVFLTQLEEASAQKTDVFITPECWLDGYAAPDKTSTPEKLKTVAQDLEASEYLKRVSKEAANRKMMICFGFTSIENGQLFNTAGLWDGDGKRIGLYHKTHLQTHDLQYSPGEALPVWDSAFGKVGIMICADRRWPETPRTLRLEGARLILNPTYGFSGDMNEAIMRTRSFENQCFIAFAHPQTSLVTGPKGKVVVKWDGDTEGVAVCDIDLSEAKEDNHLRDRRPEIYGAITAPKKQAE